MPAAQPVVTKNGAFVSSASDLPSCLPATKIIFSLDPSNNYGVTWMIAHGSARDRKNIKIDRSNCMLAGRIDWNKRAFSYGRGSSDASRHQPETKNAATGTARKMSIMICALLKT
ncbi:hypothetical protein [Sphingobium mellinum]|uniref:hypothetical protein n=1 Tax=Sphingobium mellinum TaxID=1387166 RepID=UPI0030ED5407